MTTMKFKAISADFFVTDLTKKKLKWPIGRSWVQILPVLISLGILQIEDFFFFFFAS